MSDKIRWFIPQIYYSNDGEILSWRSTAYSTEQ